MVSTRLLARLDIKAPNLIKGVHLEGLRVVGSPGEYARRYYEQGADELLYMDIVASLYGRNNLEEIVSETAHDVFIPMCVGGGIRSVEDATRLLRAGADKVAINTAAISDPDLIERLSRRFGSQSIVLSIEAKRTATGWEAYTDNGREKTGLDAVEWAIEAAGRGVGEILVTSVDREGTRKGFDVALTAAIADAVPVPVIASGGLGTGHHLVEVVQKGHADAVAVADALHYDRVSLSEMRRIARESGINVRAA
jgi:cyclase